MPPNPFKPAKSAKLAKPFKAAKIASKKVFAKKRAIIKTGSHALSNARAKDMGRRVFEVFVKKGTKAPPALAFKLMKNQKGSLFKRFFGKGTVDRKNPVSSRFNRFYRNEMPRYDELLSTSTVREFFNGFFTEKNYSALFPPERKRVDDVADFISAVRIPTHFSGYSLSATDIMQHPTSGGVGYFGRYKGNSASLHSNLDMKRKELVIEAGEIARQSPNATIEDVTQAMLKVAIEFTLNHFTAPVSADNVFSFSGKSTADINGTAIAEQLQAREAMKGMYVDYLGGTLRSSEVETPLQARKREWQRGLTIPTGAIGLSQLEPPSPRRVF